MNKIIKLICLLVLIAFLASYFIIQTGYYDYELQNKVNLTDKQIKKFESDVKKGKKIDINNYVVESNKDYSNNLTKSVYKASNATNKALKKSIESVFSVINDLVQ